ncbi:hypothetical protein D3C75_1241770 [compost metagenome]
MRFFSRDNSRPMSKLCLIEPVLNEPCRSVTLARVSVGFQRDFRPRFIHQTPPMFCAAPPSPGLVTM